MVWHFYNANLYHELRRKGLICSDKFMSMGQINEASKKAKTTTLKSEVKYLKISYRFSLILRYLDFFLIFIEILKNSY